MKRAALFATVIAFLLPSGLWAVTYEIDNAHSSIGFNIRHLGIAKVKGYFHDFEGTIVYDENDVENGSATVTIQTTSIDTGNDDRDNHLRSPDFFEVETYPAITFVSTGVERSDDGLVLMGDLTIHGVTRRVEIPFEVLGTMRDHEGKMRAGFEGSLTLKREDFGVGWQDLKWRPPLIGNDVEITLNLETVEK